MSMSEKNSQHSTKRRVNSIQCDDEERHFPADFEVTPNYSIFLYTFKYTRSNRSPSVHFHCPLFSIWPQFCQMCIRFHTAYLLVLISVHMETTHGFCTTCAGAGTLMTSETTFLASRNVTAAGLFVTSFRVYLYFNVYRVYSNYLFLCVQRRNRYRI
jgi:hypothetical protein